MRMRHMSSVQTLLTQNLLNYAALHPSQRPLVHSVFVC